MSLSARQHASDALDHWGAGRLFEAEGLYRLAIQDSADEPHHDVSSYHTLLGQVLAQLGKESEAEQHLLKAIELARTNSDEDSNIVAIARYFCAEFYASKHPTKALEVLAPALAGASSLAGILLFVHAEAHWMLDRREQARASAARSLEMAVNDEQRGNMQERLAALPGWAES